MKYIYDQEVDCAYLYVQEGETKIVKTRQISEGVYVDLDSEGNVVGVELLFLRERGISPDMLTVAARKQTLEEAQHKVYAADHPIDARAVEAARQRNKHQAPDQHR